MHRDAASAHMTSELELPVWLHLCRGFPPRAVQNLGLVRAAWRGLGFMEGRFKQSANEDAPR